MNPSLIYMNHTDIKISQNYDHFDKETTKCYAITEDVIAPKNSIEVVYEVLIK